MVRKEGEAKRVILSLVLEKLIDYTLLSLGIINDCCIIKVLKATCHLNLLLPNTLIVSFMVTSVEASARAWCLMCSDLEGDQAGDDGGDAQAGDGVATGFL